MRFEKSCGVVAVRENGEARRYLVIRSVNGQYGFPKGHMESGETEIKTALRELKEETGASAELLPGFRAETEYPVPGDADVRKRVVYFLGRFLPGKICRQESEVLEADFLTYAEAMERMQFANNREILEKAESFLTAASQAF